MPGRKTIIAASVLALLVVLYAAAGAWLAPRFLRDALAERASQLGLTLQVADVRTDPFALSVALDGVVVSTSERELARAEHLRADLAWASLWSDAWIVQQATLRQPRVNVVIGPEGRIDLPVGGTEGRQQGISVTIQSLVVEEGAAHVLDRSRAAPVEVRLEAIGLRATGLSTLEGETAQYELSAGVAAGGTLSSSGSVTLEPGSAQGRIGVAALPLSLAVRDAGGQVHGSAQYSYEGGKLVLRDVSLEGARIAHSGIELSQVALRSPRIVLPSKEAFELSGKASLAPAGEVSASGRISVQPFTADLQVQAQGLPLPQAGRLLPEGAAVKIASGTASANGRVRIQPARSSFEGTVAARDARFEESGSGQLLLAWKEIATERAALSFAPFRAELGEVVARAPAGRLVIEKDGKLNFARVIPGAGDAPDEPPARISVRRLRIEGGTLDFADRSLDNDFAVTVRELDGALTGFSTEPGNPARVQLEGRVAQYGSARIRGRIDLEAPKSLTNITATLRNVPLAELTPYIVKFAGYRVESGRVSAALRYRVRDGRLVGQNELTFEELKLGDKVQRAGAQDLPLELAVALLADAKGRIRLDIPVSGNLNDPQFDFGGLVARALGNVVGKIVSAPFRALAALLGEGGMDLDSVRFEPGTTELTPPAEENVAKVAKALAERPRLGVTVQGSYDAERDPAALRRQTARRHIAQRAGYEGGGPLDFSDPKVLQAAENLYLERVGNRLEMLKLRETEPRYARALVDKLATALPVSQDATETLARARGETVRAALLAHGVDPSRVQVEAPAVKEAGDGGVPTLLSLNTEGGASAGATAR